MTGAPAGRRRVAVALGGRNAKVARGVAPPPIAPPQDPFNGLAGAFGGAGLGSLALALEASLLAEDLASFAKAAWHILEPGTSLKWGWALDAICEHLMAVTRGQITRLLMNVPPGCMKSLLTGVIWPAWEWTQQSKRHYRYLGTSHRQDLAVRDNLKCRRLIQSEWYQRRWPLRLLSDQNAKTKFENEGTGFREAMAFTSMTGSRGDRVLLDDPLSVDQGNSAADIKAAELTFTESLPTRVNNELSAIVVIMQRLASGDTSGIILSRGLGYTHLMLPMRFEPKRRCVTSIGFKDPRIKDGELLFPERFSAAAVDQLEAVLGKFATAGQLQQNPTPRGGGMFEEKYIQFWPAGEPLPDFEYVLQSYDTAFTEDTANDPNACTVWGVFKQPKSKLYAILLLEAWDERLRYSKVRKRMIADWTAEYGGRESDMLHPPRRADAVLVENKGSGISLLQEIREAGVPAIVYNPGGADKYARAEQIMPLYEQRLVYVIESRHPDVGKGAVEGRAVTWARKFLNLLAQFGPGVVAEDDYVDTLTQAMRYLRDKNFLALPKVPLEEEKEHDYAKDKAKQRNPYD